MVYKTLYNIDQNFIVKFKVCALPCFTKPCFTRVLYVEINYCSVKKILATLSMKPDRVYTQ